MTTSRGDSRVTPRPKEHVWRERTEWPLALVAVAFLAVYSVHVLNRPHGVEPQVMMAAAWTSWTLFMVDYLIRLALTTDRRHWFVHHLFDLLIVALPLMGPLRLLRVVVLVGAFEKAAGAALRGRMLIYTITGVVLLIYVSSLAIFTEERDKPGANITSFGNALWWAITTVTGVGYGDLYPVTVPGRLIAVLLMIGGISLIGVVTAALASWIVQRVSESNAVNQEMTPPYVEELRNQIETLTKEMRRDRSDVGGTLHDTEHPPRDSAAMQRATP